MSFGQAPQGLLTLFMFQEYREYNDPRQAMRFLTLLLLLVAGWAGTCYGQEQATDGQTALDTFDYQAMAQKVCDCAEKRLAQKQALKARAKTFAVCYTLNPALRAQREKLDNQAAREFMERVEQKLSAVCPKTGKRVRKARKQYRRKQKRERE
jgi:hypothetical protein